ncbi:MAG: hypothetical protein N2504_07685 [candidate division WOR-3 bacterium]|nr:hypothetical protein [candidate division WOR-3 bacterium]
MRIKIWSRQKSQPKEGNIWEQIGRALEGFLASEKTSLVFEVSRDDIEISIGNVKLKIDLQPQMNLGKLKITKIAEKTYEMKYDPQGTQGNANDYVKLAILFYNLQNLYINIHTQTLTNFGILFLGILAMILYGMKKK